MTTFWTYGLGLWLVLLALAMLNGVARVALSQPRLGQERARQVHTVLLALVALGLAVPFVRAQGVAQAGPLWGLGAAWAGLTVAFECAMGRARGLPWSEIFADWNLARGRLWPLFLLFLTATPWCAARLTLAP